MVFLRTSREIRNKNGELHFRRFTIFSCRWFEIHIHKFYKSIKDKDCHDHPWDFITFILWGGYIEQLKDIGVEPRWMFSAVYHKAEDAHNIKLFTKDNGKEDPSISLVITGPRRRDWGFHTPKGWMTPDSYEQYKKTEEYNERLY